MKRVKKGAVSPNEIRRSGIKLMPKQKDGEVWLQFKENMQEQDDFPQIARVWICILAYCVFAPIGLFILYFNLNPEDWLVLMDMVNASKSSPVRGWFT